MNMKKIFLFAALALAAFCPKTQAQSSTSVVDDGQNSLIIRPVIGLDITCPSDINAMDNVAKINAYDPGAGLRFGADISFPVWKNLYIQPGAQFYYHTVKANKDLLANMDFGDEAAPVSQSIREFGLSIPVMVGYYFNLDVVKLHVFTGPEFNLGFSGKAHSTFQVGNQKMSNSESIYDFFRRGDVAWVLGLGVEFQRYYFSISARPGMVNWLKDSAVLDEELNKVGDVKMKRTNVSFTFGYNFSL